MFVPLFGQLEITKISEAEEEFQASSGARPQRFRQEESHLLTKHTILQ